MTVCWMLLSFNFSSKIEACVWLLKLVEIFIWIFFTCWLCTMKSNKAYKQYFVAQYSTELVLLLLLNLGARVTLLLPERMHGKNVRAKAHLCMHRLYPSLSTTWNNMQIGASTSIILFIVFTHFQFVFSYNSGSNQLINTIGLLDFVSHQHHIFIFWKGWWNTNSIRKTLLARASVSCCTRVMYYGCFVSVA